MVAYKEKYDAIVSFGCMCSCARFLEDNGFRNKSCFFDWIDTSLKSNMDIIDNEFNDVLNKQYLKQIYNDSLNVITNTKYNFSFAHVFDIHKTYDQQIETVKKKVYRSINNFNLLRNNDLLLLYYCRDKNEQEWIIKNENLIENFCYRNNFSMAFIFNFPVTERFDFKYFVIGQNNIHKPFGGGVSWPFSNTEQIICWMNSMVTKEYILKNLEYLKSRKLNFVGKISLKIRNAIRRLKRKKLFLNNEDA